jgi:hypothetical protein
VTAAQLTSNWIDAARGQLASTPLETRARALSHAVGYGLHTADLANASRPGRIRTVLVAGIDAPLEKQLRSAGFAVKPIDFTPFDADEAAKIPHFDTYNRTAASQRVADIVDAWRASPDAALVASGDAALAGLLASAVVPGRRAVLDVDRFDASSDAAFVERLYMPGLRRAGDLATAAAMAGDRVVIHNTGDRFAEMGPGVRKHALTPREIVQMLRER